MREKSHTTGGSILWYTHLSGTGVTILQFSCSTCCRLNNVYKNIGESGDFKGANKHLESLNGVARFVNNLGCRVPPATLPPPGAVNGSTWSTRVSLPIYLCRLWACFLVAPAQWPPSGWPLCPLHATRCITSGGASGRSVSHSGCTLE